MSLETATYINQLDAANPLGSDPISAGDDHLRLIKATVKATFPNITGPVSKTHTQLNNTLDKTGDTMSGPLVLSGDATAALNPVSKQQFDAAVSPLNSSVSSLSSTKADKTVAISAGTGLSGGGDLSANRSLAIANTGVTAGSYGSSTVSHSLTVNSQGQITAISNATIPLFGIGQTWQNVMPSRGSGIAYTNSTSNPIMVILGASASSGSPNVKVVVDGVTIVDFTFPYGSGNPVSFVVPPGSTYTCTFAAGTTMARWVELR